MTPYPTVPPVLAIAIVVFVGVASAILVWDGLATGFGRRAGVVARERHRALSRFAFGALGVVVALWLALGMITRVR